MRKLTVLAVLFLSVVLFSCNNAQSTNDENIDSTKTDVVETDINEDENTIEEDKPVVLEEVTINIADIKNGDIVEGLKVTSIEYQTGYMYNIALEGKCSVTGKLQYNDFEETTEFLLDETSFPKTSLNVEGDINELYKFLMFSNLEQLKSALSSYQSGQAVNVSIQIKNLSLETYLDKGRLGMGYAEFIKIN